jgi:hypothetical protein
LLVGLDLVDQHLVGPADRQDHLHIGPVDLPLGYEQLFLDSGAAHALVGDGLGRRAELAQELRILFHPRLFPELPGQVAQARAQLLRQIRLRGGPGF